MKFKLDENLPVELLDAGIVPFRPPSSGRSAVLGFVRRHLPLLLEQAQSGHFLVITERSARMR